MEDYSSFFVSRTRNVLAAFRGYVRGLFQSERVNMPRIDEANATDHQAMQHMLTEASVDWNGLGDALAKETDALLGGASSVLILDESAIAKKGDSSAGVARQWNGRLGKVDNCQVGVFAALSRGEHVSLIDGRLYLPQRWVTDTARCQKAAIPEAERRYRSKSELALERVDTAVRRGMRFGAIAVDGGYGKEPAFLRELDRRSHRFVADVHCDQRVYEQAPAPVVPAGSPGAGAVPARRWRKRPLCGSMTGPRSSRRRLGAS